MTLQSSGAISLSQIAVELGRAANAQTSLGETASRNLAGVASGQISASNFYGKSNVTITFNPVDGSYSRDTTTGAQSFTITASTSVVWTWTKTGQGTATIANGGSGTSITFNANLNQTGTFNVSSNGHSWTIDFLGL